MRIIELSIVLFIWIFVFLSPIIISDNRSELTWHKVWPFWQRFLPYLLLSLLNHFVLFPLVFVNRKKYWYLITSIITIFIFSLGIEKLSEPEQRVNVTEMNQPAQMHEPPSNVTMPGLRPGGRIEDSKSENDASDALPPFLNYAFLALLILGFDTGLRSIFKWTTTEREKEILEKEKVKSELAFLRNQVNPHFLMNTLNNIHALVDIDSEEAKDTVIRLSKLMRYLLYDTERELIPIKEELSFIKSYVELMKMRISKRVSVSLAIHTTDEERQIPPLLFTSLIENAFKYGISHRMDTFVNIDFETTEKELIFNLSNTIAQKPKSNSIYSGIGLENTRKRLDILYGNRYSFELNSENNIFSVLLKLPL